MSERYLSRAKFWKPAPEPYPNVCACIGTEIGFFHERYWWHAAGPARQQFSLVEPEIVEQLNSVFTERYSSIVLFHLYMIGRSREVATPTIMFFCEEKEPRKMAKKTVDEGGLLAKLPAFRTGHLAKQPRLGKLIQPATGGEEAQSSSEPGLASEVYFDSSHPVKAVGMPIFVKQADNVLRRATANAVVDGETYVYLTASHVFFDDVSSPPARSFACNSEYDFGSGTESEDEEDCLDATSRASVSSLEENSDDQSTTTKKSTSTTGSELCPYAWDQESPDKESVEESPGKRPVQRRASNRIDRQVGVSCESLKYLGNIGLYSTAQDWALISICHTRVYSKVAELKKNARKQSDQWQVIPSKGNAKIIAHTSRGHIPGQLSQSATYLRLPNSTQFQKTHEIILDSALEWGDCGASVSNALTEEPYGHIVVSSSTKQIAYIVPGIEVARTSATQWNIPINGLPASSGLIDVEKTRDFTSSSSRLTECLHKSQSSARIFLSSPYEAEPVRSLSERACLTSAVSPLDLILQITPSLLAALKCEVLPSPISPRLSQWVVLSSLNDQSMAFVNVRPHDIPWITAALYNAGVRGSISHEKHSTSHEIYKQWIPTCFRHLSNVLGTLYMAYYFREDMTEPDVRTVDSSVLSVLYLVIGDVITRTETSLEVHVNGLEAIIEQRGGLGRLNTLVASMISWVALEAAIFDEVRPKATYKEYDRFMAVQSRSPSQTTPESPLYRPNDTFEKLGRSSHCNANTRRLLDDVYLLIAIFLDTPNPYKKTYIMSLHEQILRWPSVVTTSETTIVTEDNWRYEAIRICAVVLSTAIMEGIALSSVLAPVTSLFKKPISRPVNTETSENTLRQPACEWHIAEESAVASADEYSSSCNLWLSPKHALVSSSSSIPSHLSETRRNLVDYPAILPKLREALENSDLSDSWGDMAGVLLWIGLTMGAASRKSKDKALKSYFSAIAISASSVSCFAYPGALRVALARMEAINEALRTASETSKAVDLDYFLSRDRGKV